ncbi:hypothetical protein [Spiroplasma endosymbiont of Glossina fuscipes fuscipes]|uniref:hypothetical protein n=1 Tax=Spiroplasma endosymbiont of Glossina fuscipes fuscipes TaxID=2004463 RepID=UPI003CF9022A
MLQQLETAAQANGFLDLTVDAYLPTVAFFQKHHYSAIKKNLHLSQNQEWNGNTF